MAGNFHGCTVSVTCKDGLGVYQGLVLEVIGETQTIVLSKPFKNGLPCPQPQITLSALTIEDIKIIDNAESCDKTADQSTVIVSKPIPKRAHRTVSENIAQFQPSQSAPNPSNKQFNNKPSTKSESPRKAPSVADSFQSALFIDSNKKNPRHKWTERDEACFGEPIKPHYFKQEFDFEKNLALFNKQAVFEEINAQQKPDLLKQTDKPHRGFKADDTPTKFRHILQNPSRIKQYVTDEGLTVTSISPTMRDHLFTTIQEMEFGFSRLAELMGRATTEIAIPLLGGAHRLNPLSNQEKPLVVVLAGPHRPGAMAINSARQLASQGVNTVLFLSHPTLYAPCVSQELALYRHTGQTVTDNIYELPASGVDLIIVGLADEHTQKINRHVASWVADNKCVLLAVDPPHHGTPNIPVRFSVVPALPTAHSRDNGKLFLANVAIPLKVFSQLNIGYRSPFGSKFVIPLHAKD